MLIILPQHNCTQEETGYVAEPYYKLSFIIHLSMVYSLMVSCLAWLKESCGKYDLYCDGRSDGSSVQESWHYHRGLALHGILLSLAGSE